MVCTTKAILLAGAALSRAAVLPATADDAKTLEQAINFFENAQATGGNPMSVDAKGPVAITHVVELPGFGFAVYNVDITGESLTMKLVA